MTGLMDMFEDDAAEDAADDEIEITRPDTSASERSTRAAIILDEIGMVELDIRGGIYSNAVEFVSDMQDRLDESRKRKTEFFCSERQLEWLESIYEKVNS